jgi:hypothetical protein
MLLPVSVKRDNAREASHSGAIPVTLATVQQSEIRTARRNEAADFLEAGQGVDQGHLRNALANALRRIADLTERVQQLERQ